MIEKSLFCANCGTQLTSTVCLCPSCKFDPNIPEEIVDAELNNLIHLKSEKKINSILEYPGESSSLAFSILLMIIIALFFSAITLGIFLVYLIVGLIYLRIRQAQDKAHFVKVSKTNYPEIYKLSKIAAFRLKTPLPPVFIKDDPHKNAYTSGFWGDHWIVIHSAIIKLLTKEEILYVIGHETGHIKKEHATWLSLTSARGAASLPIISSGLNIIFNNWHIKSEYSADRAGFYSNRSLSSCISALLMIVTGRRNIELNSYLKDSEKIQKNPFTKMSELLRTHPYIPNRIKQLQNFAEYIKLNS